MGILHLILRLCFRPDTTTPVSSGSEPVSVPVRAPAPAPAPAPTLSATSGLAPKSLPLSTSKPSPSAEAEIEIDTAAVETSTTALAASHGLGSMNTTTTTPIQTPKPHRRSSRISLLTPKPSRTPLVITTDIISHPYPLQPRSRLRPGASGQQESRRRRDAIGNRGDGVDQSRDHPHKRRHSFVISDRTVSSPESDGRSSADAHKGILRYNRGSRGGVMIPSGLSRRATLHMYENSLSSLPLSPEDAARTSLLPHGGRFHAQSRFASNPDFRTPRKLTKARMVEGDWELVRLDGGSGVGDGV